MLVMAKNNLDEDIFKVLKQRGIELNTHVENIFRFTGYNNARTLASFNCTTGVQEIEECLRTTLGKKDRHDEMDSRYCQPFEIPALRICAVNFYTVCLTQLTTVNFCVVLQAIIDSLWKMSKHEKRP
jgi:hypothetical protein